MRYQRLGGSNLKISCLGLGGNIFGAFCNIHATAKIVNAARDMGINFIDTANVYSDGLSESYIGKAIHGSRDHWVIASKVGVRSDESPQKKGRRENILNSVEGSLMRMNVDHIDLYQMHHFDAETPLEETLSILDVLVKQGKVRYIGVSNFSGEQLKTALVVSREQGLKTFVSTQNHYNLFKRNIERDIFPLCNSEKIGVMVYGALARGILSGKYRDGKEIPPDSRASISMDIKADLTGTVLNAVSSLDLFAKKYGKTVRDLALAWVLKRQEVSTVLIGVRNVEQLRDNVHAIDWELSETELHATHKLVGDLKCFQSVSLGSFPS